MSEIVPVIVCGASGRMGRELIELCGTTPGIKLVGACVRSSSSLSGQLVAGIRVTNSLHDALTQAEDTPSRPVVIDFSSPDALFHHASSAQDLKLPLLVAVSGVHEEHRNHLAKVSAQIPVLVAPNTSIAANLLAMLSGLAAQILENADIEICEAHHRNKKDSPSGTAYFLADHIAQARGKRLDEVACFNRHERGPRKPGEIGVYGLRGGNEVGTHTVHLFDDDETVELTVRTTNRRVWAAGALVAARFLASQPAGLYNMLDVFKLVSPNRENAL